MGRLKGWLYCFMWFTSILAGYAGLFCPLLPLLFLSNKLYRQFSDALFTNWQCYATVLLDIISGCDIQVSGDPILTNETSLLVMNHRTRTDWNFFWPASYHCVIGKHKFKHSTKFVLKDIIRHIPGPGWVMQLACFLFIKRSWISDQKTLRKITDYFSDLSYKYCLMIFPEGTDFTRTTKFNSDKYAEKNNLPKYNFVLHPRTTGFAFLAQHLLEKNALDAIYDITLIYPDVVPQNELVLLNGMFPKQVKFHLTRYPKSILPKDEEGLKFFLEKCWSDKEKVLKEYSETGNFLHGAILKQEKSFTLYLCFVFWSILPLIVLNLFIFVTSFRYFVLGHTLLILVANFISGGFQNFEVAVYNLKKRIFRLI